MPIMWNGILAQGALYGQRLPIISSTICLTMILKELAELEEDVYFVDAIRGHIRDFLDIGTMKSFKLKDPAGNILCEYDDYLLLFLK